MTPGSASASRVLDGAETGDGFFDSGGTGAGRPFPKLEPLLPPSRRFAGPSIAACAIYPELDWNLTLRLTNSVRRTSAD